MEYFFRVIMVFLLSTIIKGDIHSLLRDLDETVYDHGSNLPRHTLSTLNDYRQELVKEEILNRLGLTNPPNISRKIFLPTQIMKNMLLPEAGEDEQITKDNNEYYGVTKQVVVMAEPENSNDTKIGGRQVLRFNIEHSYRTITSVSLAFRRDPRVLSRHMLKKDSALLLRFVKGVSVRTYQPENIINKDQNWVILNISKESLKLDNDERLIRNISVEIICEFCGKKTFVWDNESNNPFMIVNVKEKRKQLSKRSLRCNGDGKTCCVVKYRVRFSDLGWGNWILAPETVNLDYCNGSCGKLETQNTPYNLLMDRLSRPVKNAPFHEPCCVVTKMASMSILYTTGTGAHNIVKKDLPNMRALECQCT